MTGPRGQRPPGPMRDSGDSPSGAPTRMILWLAFVVAVVIYGVVGFMVAGEGYGGAGSAAIPGWLFPVVGLFLAVASLLLPSFLSGRELPSGGAPVGGADIVTWAMDESVAIVGLVTKFLGVDADYFPLYLAASAVLLVIHRPKS